MSSIATYLNQILRSVYGKDVRQAIHDAISQCYDDVNAPALQTEAMEAAVQAKIDAGEMAALTIADGSLTGAKLANSTIPTAKIADGAITMAKLSDDIDLDVETDTTLTQPDVPADAKAVGDALANAFTGESLSDGESMKFVLSSKYDDFKLVDGYGYFDAKLLLNSFFDNGRALVSGSRNKVFRATQGNGRNVLAVLTVLDEIFSPDFPIEEVEWGGINTWFNALGELQEGYWISRYPASGTIYFTIPNSAYGESATIGDYVAGYLDGSIGIKMDSARIREYDPSEVIAAIASGGNPSAVTVDGETVYKGFITWTWSDVFDFENTTANNYRMYSTFGLTNEIQDYAKDCAWFERNTRLWYRVRADAVSERTFAAVKDYLLNTKHLKFYYVSDEEVTE